MSIVDKMLKWWDSGLSPDGSVAQTKRLLAKSGDQKTYLVVRLNAPNQTVTADRYVNSGGSIQFYVGDTVVAQFQSDQVIGVERKS